MLVRPDNVPQIADAFDAMVVWMTEEPLVPGKQYWFKQTTESRRRLGQQPPLPHRRQHAAPPGSRRRSGSTKSAACQVRLNQPIAFDGYRHNKGTGAFIVIDRMTNVTVGAGMILDRTAAEQTRPLGRPGRRPPAAASAAPSRPPSAPAASARSPRRCCSPAWPAPARATIAYALERRLFDLGRAVCVLDGQNIRQGISRDLGFTVDRPQRKPAPRRRSRPSC